jgi:hypothetical protein
MKQDISESASAIRILSEKKDENGEAVLTVEVKWQQADVVNINRRKYSRKVLETAISAILPKVKAGEVWGSSFHPEDGVGEVDDISHIWKEVSIRPDGACVGIVEVLATTRGKNVQKILRKGKIGMSSRGRGTLVPVTTGDEQFEEVQDDFRLLSPGDFVLSPSVPDAGNLRTEKLITVERGLPFGELSVDEFRLSGSKTRYLGKK